MNTQKYRCLLVIVFYTVGASIPAASSTPSPDDILVIVNKSADINSLSIGELAQIFLKKKTTWSDGRRIISINATGSNSLRESFRAKVLDMGAADEATYWEKQKIRYQIEPPVEMANTPKAVFKLKSAISYAYRRDVPGNVVKVVLIIPR